MKNLLSYLPPSLVRALGRLQFHVRWLKPLIAYAGRKFASREGIIAHGIGRGLRFNATGGFPGYLFGTTEPEEQRLLESLLGPGKVFYDIGANIGFYSTLAGRLVGNGGRVYAFEPFPESAEGCRKNASLNNFGHVSVVQAAVGAQSGRIELGLGESSALNRTGPQAGGATINVPLISIDSWRQETNASGPDVVMIDIEGSELEALAGMRQTIGEFKPILMVEVHWLGDAFAEYYRRELQPLGYSLATYDGKTVPVENSRYHALLRPSPNGDRP